jgi:hypothetical protein
VALALAFVAAVGSGGWQQKAEQRAAATTSSNESEVFHLMQYAQLQRKKEGKGAIERGTGQDRKVANAEP